MGREKGHRRGRENKKRWRRVEGIRKKERG